MILPPYITYSKIETFLKQALEEDICTGDHSSLACIDPQLEQHFYIIAKDNGILAGMSLLVLILEKYPTLTAELLMQDGDTFKIGDIPVRFHGRTRDMLQLERLLLNCMQRMSGIATQTHALNQKIKGTSAKLLDTRKTTPNFRIFEKWAVKIGGGFNHRMGLYDMIMLKDNHIDSCGGLTPAIHAARTYLQRTKLNLKLEVEARSLEDVDEILETGLVDRIMFDNMTVEDMQKAVKIVGGACETEASGGIQAANIRAVAETGVNFISVGALTHSVKNLDLSLKVLSNGIKDGE